jgi:DNA-binding NtrC family response regulator
MPRKPPHILVVDDDMVTCELLCEVFTHEGFETTFEHSGEEALAALSVSQPDLLLSDIRMKTRLDGLSLLELVRRDYSAIPVVLMTAFGSIETAIRAVKEGAFDYISKPFNIDELVAIARRALANGSARQPSAILEDEGRTSGNATPPLSADDLDDLFSRLPSLDELERRYILHVLEKTGSNRKRAAEILGINRKTLYRMAARFEIELGLQPRAGNQL